MSLPLSNVRPSNAPRPIASRRRDDVAVAVLDSNHRRLQLLSLFLIFALLMALMPAIAMAAPASATTAAPASSGVYYWVQPGDTLSEIAAWHGISTHTLMQANGIHNPNHIYVGQKLYIPKGYGGGTGGYVGGPTCSYYHMVQYGQTLSHIAVYYGVNPHTLAQVNAIYDWNHVYTGQRLCIPGYQKPYNPPKPKPDYHKPDYHKPAPKPEPKPHPQPDGTCIYIVRHGDTLAEIANWFRTSVHHLVYLNNLYNVNQLEVGQVLHVPGNDCKDSKPEPKPKPVDGWTGTYFNNKWLEGAPAFVRQDGAINFDWKGDGPGEGVSNDRFSVSWDRSIYVKAGTYRFYAAADDGVRVYVDGHLIINQWSEHPTQNYFGDIYLGEGNHSVRVEYYEEGGQANIRVWWEKL